MSGMKPLLFDFVEHFSRFYHNYPRCLQGLSDVRTLAEPV